ncbi:DUF1476 domain-containing protein [Methylobacterium soli]|jgi:hypothetical protein|uniref:DUF1476 domain-containing protein n=1 Tax=Methylobacterium soli TaxID=553447 RepID=A0A6L3SZ20_9HYPH|nr:DUF1476 domain-containing protein [Methylobacterium soli]KAB1077384.1 DUF1476 domain-containing protein [Methylobacterium soli]GJE43702.1 hypothetical protein AEGHOMDF_2881 [Methylobacterium soli]
MGRLFEERERAAELMFARDEEARFIARCRRMRKLAAFVAEKLGVDGQTAEAYAVELIGALVQGMKDDALLERVQADLAANGVDESLATLRTELDRATAQAMLDAGTLAGQGRRSAASGFEAR